MFFASKVGETLYNQENLWTEVHNTVQEAVTKTIPKKKKFKRAKWLSEETLQIAEERIKVKSKEEMERHA